MKFLNDNSVLDIQEANLRDAKEFHAFLQVIKEESKFLVVKDTGIEKSVSELEDYLSKLKGKVTSKLFLGKVSGKIVASGGIYHRSESIEGNVILDINLLEDYLGLGTEKHIVNHVINYARITSLISSIDILSMEDNQVMIAVYKGLGFKEINTDDEIIDLKPKNGQLVFRLKIK